MTDGNGLWRKLRPAIAASRNSENRSHDIAPPEDTPAWRAVSSTDQSWKNSSNGPPRALLASAKWIPRRRKIASRHGRRVRPVACRDRPGFWGEFSSRSLSPDPRISCPRHLLPLGRVNSVGRADQTASRCGSRNRRALFVARSDVWMTRTGKTRGYDPAKVGDLTRRAGRP
jgi:hypothetical protein